MYVVFTAVEMLPGTTEDGAVKDLKDQLIPQIKQAPGFVKGEWSATTSTATASWCSKPRTRRSRAFRRSARFLGGQGHQERRVSAPRRSLIPAARSGKLSAPLRTPSAQLQRSAHVLTLRTRCCEPTHVQPWSAHDSQGPTCESSCVLAEA
jgi:hypothetical protein